MRYTALVLLTLAAAIFAGTAAGASRHTVDLRTGTVDGRRVLGRSLPQLVAAFGRPQWRVTERKRFLLIGYGDRKNFSMMVRFAHRNGAWRAIGASFERSPLTETEIGKNVLAMPPSAFAAAVRRTYRGTVETAIPPSCRRSLCSVTFAVRGTPRRVSFGHGETGLGMYLTIWSASR
jgi:hypothetical protein